jgi:hypothetical protein
VVNGPVRDDEHGHPEHAAFSLDDVHGYAELARRIGWTILIVVIVAGICVGLYWVWRATR